MRGAALDLKARLLDRVIQTPGGVWTAGDFVDLAPRPAVDKALQRLTTAGELRRIDRGLYDRPRPNRLTDQLTVPDTRAVIAAVARRDQARVMVDGLTAANDLGLTTAVPAHVTVFTDARLRPIQLGHQKITFKTVAPSRLYWADRPAMRLVQALYWMVDLLSTDRTRLLRRLRAILREPTHGPTLREDLRAGLHTLPAWMQAIVRDLVTPSVGPRSPSRTARRKTVVRPSSATRSAGASQSASRKPSRAG